MLVSPEWFFGYDAALEFLFAIITIIVAGLAFHIHKRISEKQTKYLGFSFLFIGIGYLFQSILNFFVVTELNEKITEIINLRSIILFNTIGTDIQIFFMLIGIVLLTFMTIEPKNKKILYILLGITGLAIIFSFNPLYMFYAISSFLFIIIAEHFIINFKKHKQPKTLLIAIAFILLFFSKIHFLFAINHELFYVLGHLLELLAYSLILINFFMVLKR